jgi:hypothetical protein
MGQGLSYPSTIPRLSNVHAMKPTRWPKCVRATMADRAPFSGRIPFLGFATKKQARQCIRPNRVLDRLFMDWSFASGCSPPRLSTTQLPSATNRLSPHCWCVLSGVLLLRLRRSQAGSKDPRKEFNWQANTCVQQMSNSVAHSALLFSYLVAPRPMALTGFS